MTATKLPILPRATIGLGRYRSGGTRNNHIIVIHTSEGGEGPDSEQALTNFLSTPATSTNVASYQSWNDVDSIRPGVSTYDTAYHCGGLNSSYGHCFCGKAGQSVIDWSDAMSAPSVELGARYLAQLIYFTLHGTSDWFRWLIDQELRSLTIPGFSTHDQIRRVFGHTTHTDPGPNFPYERFMAIALNEFIACVSQRGIRMDPIGYVVDNFAFYVLDPYTQRIHGVSGPAKDNLPIPFEPLTLAELDAILAMSHQSRNGYDISD